MDYYSIHRKTEQGCRSYLKVTKTGRYTWKNDQQSSSALTADEANAILDELIRYGSSKYSYYLLWKY